MKSYRIKESSKIVLGNEEIGIPEKGEVLISIKANSLNFRDIAVLDKTYLGLMNPNVIPCSDASGVVISVGPDVDRFKVGDKVIPTFFPKWLYGAANPKVFENQYGTEIDGWLAEEKIVDQSSLCLFPDFLSFEEAATLPCAALTAWNAINGGSKINPGDVVLIQGTGGVSMFAFQFAKAMGAKVITTTSSKEKAERLKSLGADEVINYKEDKNWGGKVRSLTDGKGANYIIEVGGADTLANSIEAAAFNAEISIIGFLSGGNSVIDFLSIFNKVVNLRRVTVGSRLHLEEMLKFIDLHKIKPIIEESFSFNDSKKAYDIFKKQNFIGKVVISH